LLLLFTFSMVPKLALHALLASHKDTVVVHGKTGDTLLKSRGFSCDCSSLVVDLPFLYQGSEGGQTPLVYSITLKRIFFEAPVLSWSYARDSRGPPSV
jgi:hypothetical protein